MARIICNRCQIKKDEDDFNWRWKSKGVRQRTCRECQKEQKNHWYAKNSDAHKAKVYAHKLDIMTETRSYIWDYLSTHPCVDCGESDPRVLEFDHVSGQKRMPVTKLVIGGYSIDIIQREIDKCVVRCANCHRKKTSIESGGWRSRK